MVGIVGCYKPESEPLQMGWERRTSSWSSFPRRDLKGRRTPGTSLNKASRPLSNTGGYCLSAGTIAAPVEGEEGEKIWAGRQRKAIWSPRFSGRSNHRSS